MLVEWTGMPATEATWEPVPVFREAYPSFQLADELFPEVGEMLWWAKSINAGISKVADPLRLGLGPRNIG
jgi:hypothetical protein